MTSGEVIEQKVFEAYLRQARGYLKSGVVVDPALQEPGMLAVHLMAVDGVDLSRIRTGDQKVPDVYNL